ncbi:MAG TPA: hypothetical protein VFJ96_13205 [Gemmatimonadaceae bacterium]|jgi:hypothetical protein|nr:hypothetical protein [Gemmatimonadaceae bacterium]
MQKLPAVLLALACAAPAAFAQGTLSTQGFGYPPGELSTRAASTGGATAPFDPISPVNPASLSSWGRTALYFQYSPEFRSVSVPGGSDHATITRFPLLAAAVGIGSHTTFGISASTFLDRTWQTQLTSFQHGNQGDSTQFTENFSVNGAINDLRLGGAYQIIPALRIGVAGHVYTGENRLDISRTFADSSFASFSQNSSIGFAGSAVSGGIEAEPVHGLWLAATGRLGGPITATRNDTTLSRGYIPNSYGGAVEITAIGGLLLAARAEWTGWSTMSKLGAGDVTGFDGWDMGVGAEASGPTLLGSSMPLRLGFRHRTLPFAVSGHEVTENAVAAGFGIPIAGDRSRLDFGLERASRTADVAGKEHAWTISAGLFVRP